MADVKARAGTNPPAGREAKGKRVVRGKWG